MSDVNKINVKHFTINPLSSKGKNSFSWKHFGQLILENDGKRKYVFVDQVFCANCLETAKSLTPDSSFGCLKIKSYSSKVSTGNLIRHLKDDHSLSEEKSATTTSNLTNFFKVTRPLKSTSGETSKTQNKWTLARDLALWFCRSLMPFDSVDNEGMEDFLTKYNVIYKKEDLPSRTTISRDGLTDVYESMLDHVKQDIQANIGTHAALTTDLWQDLYRRCSYITYTLQFITDNSSDIQNYTLATRVFEGKKTGEALSAYTQNIISSFGLEEKSLTLVTDSGSNVRRISQILPGIKNHLCLGHGLHNLVTVDGIKKTQDIQNLVLKCKKVVKSLRYRLPEVEDEADKEQRRILTGLDEIHDYLEDDENFPLEQPDAIDVPVSADEHGESSFIDTYCPRAAKPAPVPSIKSATPTRWHSTLAMLQSLSSMFNRKPVNTLLAKYNLSEFKFEEQEWKLIEDLTRFLGKFKRIVEVLSSQTHCSINVALVFRSEIKDACETLDENEKLVMMRMKRNMSEMLNHRFPITNLTVAAALLDCRFSKLKEIDLYLENIHTTRVTFLTDYIKEVVPANELESHSLKKHGSETNSYLIKLAQKHADAEVDQEEYIEKECLKYLVSCDPDDLSDGNIIKYWQNRRATFPLLYKLAKAILSVPATSTPSERVFSIAGLTVTAKRSRLSPARVDKIIFVHDNYKVCKTAIN